MPSKAEGIVRYDDPTQQGGGRRRVDDRIDASVGLADVVGVGESVGPDRPLCVVHARDEAAAARAADGVRAAMTVGDRAARPGPVVRQRIGGGDP